MLTSQQSLVLFDRGRALPDRLTRGRHRHYLQLAAKTLAVYRAGVGQARRELHRSVEGIFAAEPDCPAKRIDAFCKLLDDASEFESDPSGRAARLRLDVFSRAAPHHPLVRSADRLFERSEAEIKLAIARGLGRPWDEIDAALYADVIDQQRMVRFEGFESPEALLSRYNVAQLQACLYRAASMTVYAAADFKTILRHAKLSRLLHEIRRLGPARYEIALTGPASVLSGTRRYGVNFAMFVPALLACRGWKLRAELRTPWGRPARLELTARDGYRSHLPPPHEFDSSVEEKFAAKFGPGRDGWRLERETEILHEGQSVILPDFVFRHADGTAVLFEIVGFWTPQYLEKKREALGRLRRSRALIAVAEASLRRRSPLPEDVIAYKTAIDPDAVLAALEKMRAGRGAQVPQATR